VSSPMRQNPSEFEAVDERVGRFNVSRSSSNLTANERGANRMGGSALAGRALVVVRDDVYNNKHSYRSITVGVGCCQ
jgi:hypothetical protein